MDADGVMEVVEEVQTSDAEIDTPSTSMQEVRSETVIDLVKKDSEYDKKLKDFKRLRKKEYQEMRRPIPITPADALGC